MGIFQFGTKYKFTGPSCSISTIKLLLDLDVYRNGMGTCI